MLDLRRGGGYAEYTIVKENEAAMKPCRVTHSQAASIPLVALTAWQTLFDVADLQEGQTVLIHAGAGGVGSIAIQLAKWRGARVIATASEYNHEFLRELGADVQVDYRTQRFEDFASDIDVVLDTVGGETPQGRNPQRDINVSSILVRPDSEQLSRIGELIENDIVRPIVNYRFPLHRAPEAHEQSETRRSRGKIVLELD
jgi:NADPH:quinone reductase-like Zn-dependent oxidoreductase